MGTCPSMDTLTASSSGLCRVEERWGRRMGPGEGDRAGSRNIARFKPRPCFNPQT